MKVFIYSPVPSVLFINGERKTNADNNLLIIDAKYNDFLSFYPISPTYNAVFGELDKGFAFETFSAFDGLILMPKFTKKNDLPYKVIQQENLAFSRENLVITLVSDGTCKFYLNGNFFYTTSLPFISRKFEYKIVDNYVFIAFYGEKIALYCFNASNGELCYYDVVDEFEILNNLKIVKKRQFVDLSTITETWNYSGAFSLISREVKMQRGYQKINKNLIPLEFFNQVKIGGDFESILAENLVSKKHLIIDFIQNPTYILPSPYILGDTVIIANKKALIYTVTINNDKITNIIEK